MENEWTKKIAELTASRDHWKKEWSLMNAAEIKAEEKVKKLERDIADAKGFVKSLILLVCGNEYVTNHPKEEWVTWIQGVFRDFGPHLAKRIAELTAANERMREAINMLIDFIPDGWEMPLGYAQIVAQAQAAKEAQDGPE